MPGDLMGHVRLGELPRTRKWDQVVELIKSDGDAAQIAGAALDAADAGFREAANDEGCGSTGATTHAAALMLWNSVSA